MALKPIPKHGIKCKHNGCQHYKSSKIGYCEAHHYQFKRYGETWDIRENGQNYYTFYPEQGIVKILISSNYETIIDIEDFYLVSQYTWYIINNVTSDNSYAQTIVNGKTIRLHRIIMDVDDRNIFIDHINGNGLDNRKINLRICDTPSHNNANSRLVKIKSASGYKGVRISGKKFKAEISYNNEYIYLGTFETALDAHNAYCKKGFELYGEFFNPDY